jgi:hypothetical protein
MAGHIRWVPRWWWKGAVATALAVAYQCATAQSLSITPLLGSVMFSKQTDAGAIQDTIVDAQFGNAAAYGDAFQWTRVDPSLGSIKYLTHINTQENGVPTLEAAGQVYSDALSAMAYRFSNEGAVPVTLPTGAIQFSLTSTSGALRLPSTESVPRDSMVSLMHSEGLFFVFGHEVPNAEMDAYTQALLNDRDVIKVTHLAMGATTNAHVFEGNEQAWIRDEATYAENVYVLDDIEFIPFGRLSVGAVERGVSLNMSLASNAPISIAPGTSRIFMVMAGSTVSIYTEGQASASNFPYVFKDATHSATLALQLPADVALTGEVPQWVSAVPEAPSVPMALAGLLGVVAMRRWQRWRRVDCR